MFQYPQYEENGQERLFFPNLWRNISPQQITGADCFSPTANLNNDENLIVLKMTAQEFTRMFSALYNGAVQTYPDSFMQILVNFLKGLHCPPLMVEQECFDYPSYASFMQYSPMNPYINPDTIPEGYETQPFVVYEEPPTGYAEFDVFVPFDSLTLDVDWFTDIAGQLPTITVIVNGAGKAFLKFLPVVQGGLICVTVDNPPNLIDILGGIITGADNLIDLNLDIVSVPPETAKEIIYELDIEGTGIHTIYAVFLPIIDDSFIPVRFGGGFRGVQLCNFVESPEMGITAVRLNEENCTLEYQINGEWLPVSGWDNINDCVIPTSIAPEAVEAVLPSSATIIAITEAAAATNEAVAENSEAIAELDALPEGGNITPAIASYENEFLCNAATYIVAQLIAKITEVWTDAETITLEEFLRTLLFGGGWDASLLNQLWDLAITMGNPYLVDEVTDATDAMISILYCDGLNRANFIAQVNGDVTITDDAKSAITAAFDAITDVQYSQWAFIGSVAADGDCSCATTKVWDFAGGQQGWAAQGGRADWDGSGWVPHSNPYGYTIVIENGFTWPSDMVITQMRCYMDNRSGASYKYFYGMNYANGTWTAYDFDTTGIQNSVPVDKGTRVGLGFEFSIFTPAGQKITRIEVDYTGTESPDW